MNLKEAHEVDYRDASDNENEQVLSMTVEEAERFFEDADMVLTSSGVVAIVEGVGFDMASLAAQRSERIDEAE